MLSKFQADAVGDAIVGAERERQAATREAVASRVPFFYASSALAMHSHWEQAALLSQARRTALVGWHAGLLIFTWLLFVAGIGFALSPIKSSPIAWVLLPALVLMGVQVRVLLVRTRLQSLLLDKLTRSRAHGI